jgi:Tfp pilus assembly protein PilF
MRLFVILLLLMPLLTGCEAVQKGFKDITSKLDPDAPRPKPEPTRSAEDLLAAGIAQYEEGSYGQAQRLLQSSLAEGLATRPSQARAYKHLAFIYCITDRLPQCRQEFMNAFAADPNFNLTPAEASHPNWGPVYRGVSGRSPR